MKMTNRFFPVAAALAACLLVGGSRAEAWQVEHVKGKVEKVDSHTGGKTTVTMIDRVTTTKGEPKIDRTVDKTVDKTKTSGKPGEGSGKKGISGVLNGTERSKGSPTATTTQTN